MSIVPLPRVAPDEVRDRAVRLFTFLKEYTQLRASTALTTDAYDEVIWMADVPGLPGCSCALDEPHHDGEVWLEVRKPRLAAPPRPPELLEPWLTSWADSAPDTPTLRDSLPDGEAEPGAEPPRIQLDDRPNVRAAYDEYVSERWLPWARRDRPLQRTQRIYTDLFRLHQSQQRLGEAYEVVLGIGHLAWRAPSGNVARRHLVVAQTDVRFDADRGIITVTAAADGARPVLEQDMLQPGERPPANVLDEIAADLAGAGDDVLTDAIVASAVRRWAHGASARGHFDDSLRPSSEAPDDPAVHLAPAVILRRRTDRSIVQALAAIADELRDGAPMPEGVRRLVSLADSAPASSSDNEHEDGDPLFPLPANDTQLDIVRRLRDRPGVLVQGPPGTGKSHTIANLVAHLLANGERVLVTSHTARALEVLRDKVPPDIRELAVVVLGNDARGRDELQASVHGISERYASWDERRSQERTAAHRRELDRARAAEAELRGRLRALRERDVERHPLLFGGYEGTSQEIARQLRAGAAELGWLPDAVSPGSEPPLSDAEAAELLALLRSIDVLEEADLDALTVDLDGLPEPAAFAALLQAERDAATGVDGTRRVPEAIRAAAPEALDALAGAVGALRRQRAALTRRAEPWVAVAAAQVTSGMAGRWRELGRMTAEALDRVRPLVSGRGLRSWATVRHQLASLDAAWAPHRSSTGGTPALRVAEYADVAEMLDHVLGLEAAAVEMAVATADVPGLDVPAADDDEALAALLRDIDVRRRERQAEAASAAIDGLRVVGSGPPAVEGLAAAIRERDAAAYASCHELLSRLAARRALLLRRRELGERMRAAAPRLAARVTATPADEAWDAWLSHLGAAWEWARADAWLAAQASPALAVRLERDLDDARLRIERATRDLAAELAWGHCLGRLTERERAELQTWEEAVRKIGKGTGKHAARWRQRAREAMQGCRSAIPAWIMPIFKVAEAVDMTPEAFDVVIVDEASQSGPEALFLQFLARRVIVVGDDQQISPENVGVDRDKVQTLNTQYLHDVPLAMHYDADTSYFTHAAIRYGDRLVLQEHFRCMPEIIGFSNGLCYRDRPLVPLRQFGGDRLRPVVQVRHVPDGDYSDGQVNPAEAEALVEQVTACLDDPIYDGKTMGVISLVGSEQAKLIGRLLAQRIDPAEIERRRLLCGDAYAFQGDERDVMFLSLVQARRDGRRLYAGTSDRDRRRFNVAASRARDQVWLFHSARLEDLHSGGMAHRLLEYCLHPLAEPVPARGIAVEAWRRRADERAPGDSPPHPFEAWLELDVFLRLADRGFRVIPQHELAGYRVDLLIEGRRGRLAVVCDGDRWQGPEEFERDLVRQRMLERCGLPFARVRGAAYYRDPEAALEPLWADLREHDIRPS